MRMPLCSVLSVYSNSETAVKPTHFLRSRWPGETRALVTNIFRLSIPVSFNAVHLLQEPILEARSMSRRLPRTDLR